MAVVESIQKARNNGVKDEQILSEIVKQNQEKAPFFEKAKERGATATDILNEIIKQNKTEKEGEIQTPPPVPKMRKMAISEELRKKEELEREQFIKRLESREKGEPLAEEMPLPPPPVTEEIKETKEEVPEVKEKKETPKESVGSVPQRPQTGTKLWARVVIVLVLVAVTAAAAAFFYQVLILNPPSVTEVEITDPVIVEKEIPTPRAPNPLIKINPSIDHSIRFPITTSGEYIIKMRDYMRRDYDAEVVHVVTEDQREEPSRIVDMEDFFGFFEIRHPRGLFDVVEKDFTLIIYPDDGNNRIAFVSRFEREKREELEWLVMRPWEETIEKDFKGLFSFIGVEMPETNEELEQTNYSGHRIRYRETPHIEERTLMVLEEELPVYSDTESLEELGEVGFEEEYLVLEEKDEWYYISITDDFQGWVEKEGVVVLDSPKEEVGIYYIITNDLFIFSTSLNGIKTIINRL